MAAPSYLLRPSGAEAEVRRMRVGCWGPQLSSNNFFEKNLSGNEERYCLDKKTCHLKKSSSVLREARGSWKASVLPGALGLQDNHQPEDQTESLGLQHGGHVTSYQLIVDSSLYQLGSSLYRLSSLLGVLSGTQPCSLPSGCLR
jgi:hypothetical protein